MQDKGRISNLSLAEEVALSPSPCLERTKKLEKSGIIKRYITEIDLRKACPHVTIWTMVKLSSYPKSYRKIDHFIKSTDEIVESYKIMGAYDYLICFVCSNIDSYSSLINEAMDQDLGIESITTAVVMQRNKEFTGYPLRNLIQY